MASLFEVNRDVNSVTSIGGRPARISWRNGLITSVATLAIASLLLSSCTPLTPMNANALSPPLDRTQLIAGADHACIVPSGSRPNVAWGHLVNPILSSPIAGEKDEAIIWAGGMWHMLFSYVTNDPRLPGGVRWNIGTSESKNMLTWTKPSLWPSQAGVIGVASPDIVRSPSGEFVATYESEGGVSGASDKIFYRTSTTLKTWSTPHPLAPSLAPLPRARMIDPALAFTGNGLILGFKTGPNGSKAIKSSSGQAFEIAWSRSGSLKGPWRLIGIPGISIYHDTVENYEFFDANGKWHLLATSNTLDQPWLFTLAGDPLNPSSWLRWTNGHKLNVPYESWNSGPGISSIGFEHANSAFICNARADGGYYYLLYAGSRELTQFGGWGHAKIGIARSTDLVHWQVPEGPKPATPRR
ncbi:MAG: hypothetical protein M1134_04190 [Actinobacteria bacterium]|nr:hypothetical protein [Actinomycetota bacterium]